MSGRARSGRTRPLSSTSGPTRRSPDHTDTHRSLQEASVALETAFDRIRQVRRSIIELSESSATGTNPTSSTNSNTNHGGIRPEHDALVLSGSSTREAQEILYLEGIMASEDLVRSPLSTTVWTSNPPTRTTTHTLSPLTHHATQRRSPESSSATPTPPIPRVVPPRFSRQGVSGHSSSPGHSDSAATTRGLQVAAREGNQNAQSTAALLESRFDFSSIAADYERLLAQHQAMIGGVIRNFPPPPLVEDGSVGNPGIPGPYHARQQGTGPLDENTQEEIRRQQLQMWAAYVDRERPRRPGRHVGPPPPPMQVPSMAPAYLIPAPPRMPRVDSDSYPMMFGPGGDTLSGDDGVSNDQFIPWLFSTQEHSPTLVPRRDPANPDTIRITRSPERTTSPPERSSARRGWARLDPDGNEIPWDEEEQLERTRAEYRVRALQRARQQPSSQDTLRHNGRTFYGSVLDSMLSVPADSRSGSDHQSGRVDPLPMPLSSMFTKGEIQEDCYPDVIVPKHAGLAGR